MTIEKNILNKVFEALDRQLMLQKGDTIRLVVFGGSALAALDLVVRTTQDVDILGVISENEEGFTIAPLRSFPRRLTKAAEIVQRDFNLPETWLNSGPTAQVDSGLPEGLIDRLVERAYGDYLTVFYVDRYDQIFFKLYAAIDSGAASYHVSDLFALKPTEEELETASGWALTQDVSQTFRLLLIDFLRRYNHADLAERIQARTD